MAARKKKVPGLGTPLSFKGFRDPAQKETGWSRWVDELEKENEELEVEADPDGSLSVEEPGTPQAAAPLALPAPAVVAPPARDSGGSSSGFDWPKAFVIGSVAMVAIWAAWQLRQRAQEHDRNLENNMSNATNTNKTGQIAQATPAGQMAGAGDLVLASVEKLGLTGLPPQTLTIKLRVKNASPGSGSVLAKGEDLSWPAGALLPQFPVPRSAIIQVLSPQSSVFSSRRDENKNKVPEYQTGPELVAEPGVTYRARLEVTGPLAALATPPLVAARFQELGFEDIFVWSNARELPMDWPKDEEKEDRQGRFYIQGTWPSTSPREARPRPPELASVWRT